MIFYCFYIYFHSKKLCHSYTAYVYIKILTYNGFLLMQAYTLSVLYVIWMPHSLQGNPWQAEQL